MQQQLGGRVVHPLEIIQEQHRRVRKRDLLQQIADRLEQGRLIGVGWACAEFWEDQREMLGQRPGTTQAIRDRALVAAERCDDGRIGPNRPLVGRTAQHEPAILGKGGFDERGLADATLPATIRIPPSPPGAVAIAWRSAERSRSLPTSSIAPGMG